MAKVLEAGRVDAQALAAELRASIGGEVRFDDGSRGLYAADAANYRQVPIGVVIPRSKDDVVATLAACRRYGAPVLPRGGGTSLAGQCCNVAVVIDMSKYLHHVLDLDPDRQLARVQPGLIPDELNRQAAPHQLTFAPVPATHAWCTVGGMVGNNSCGVYSVVGGKTVDNVDELDVLTYDGLRMRVGATSDQELESIIAQGGRRGEIYAGLKALRDRYADLIRQRYPQIPRRVSGYNLDELLPERGFNVARALVGTEGTCATVLEATVRLMPNPPGRVLLILGYPDVYEAGDRVPELLAHQPLALEGMDGELMRYVKKKGLHPGGPELFPQGGGWLILELGGQDRQAARERAQAVMQALQRSASPPSTAVIDDPKQQHLIWLVRESGLGATARVPGESDNWPGWEDSAVPPDRVGSYLRELHGLYDKYGYVAALYGHFGDGCIHTRINFDLLTAEGIRKYGAFVEEAADLVLGYGGSLSGEHGDGQARAELLPKMFGDELVEAFREFKSIWDPQWKMNPGKVVDPYRMDENLRLGTEYRPWQPQTYFQFPGDDGSLARATERCVGVGKCRRLETGTMCPSYMVLREEQHSTRGRARMLFEMLNGDPVDGGWRDEHVKEALDLCLACKACKAECPVNVDMATYKAEFMAHYYAGRLRPASAYAFGLIFYWARLAVRVPALVNFFTQTPPFAELMKRAAGMAPERRIPRFAAQTFKTWFRQREPRNQSRRQVILWADTLNNYFYPHTARAAVEVLEAAGHQVLVPDQPLCCGRPVYDFGMLDVGKRLLRQTLNALEPQLADGTPVVVLEPSCASVFRDELVNLFPKDERARRLAEQTLLLSEFLEREVPDYQPPRLERKALVQGHCHHKSVLKMEAEFALIKKMGLDLQELDSGCCGLAGSFGYEKDHYDVSMGAGERVLLPAVRQAAGDTLVIADGFSCREQIAHATDRRALHLAEVFSLAQRHGRGGPPGEYPEKSLDGLGDSRDAATALPSPRTTAIGAGALLAGLVAWRLRRRR